jgi:hypothetical protein
MMTTKVKTPIAVDILNRLSPEARTLLADFEANVDAKTRDDILYVETTDYDRLWVPLLLLRIYRTRFMEHWDSLAHDPRFPNFRKLNINDMIMLAVGRNSNPAEAVVEVVAEFSPSEYDLTWIYNRLGPFVRDVWCCADDRDIAGMLKGGRD